MGAVESALESWDFILFDERTFRFIRTHRNNSSPHLTHTQDFQIWARITKIKVENKIMRVNCNILFLEEIWTHLFQERGSGKKKFSNRPPEKSIWNIDTKIEPEMPPRLLYMPPKYGSHSHNIQRVRFDQSWRKSKKYAFCAYRVGFPY